MGDSGHENEAASASQDVFAGIDVANFRAQLDTLSPELHMMILDFCTDAAIHRLMLAGKGYWHDLCREINYKSTIELQSWSQPRTIPEKHLAECRHAEVELAYDEDPSHNLLLVSRLEAMPKLATLDIEVHGESSVDPEDEGTLPHYMEYRELRPYLERIANLPTRPVITHLSVTRADIQCTYSVCSVLATLPVREVELWPRGPADSVEHTIYSDNEDSDGEDEHAVHDEEEASHEMVQGSPLQLAVSELDMMQSCEHLVETATKIIAPRNLRRLHLGTVPPRDDLLSALRSVSPHIETLSWQPFARPSASLHTMTWTSIRCLDLLCTQACLKLAVACRATLRDLRLGIKLVPYKTRSGFKDMRVALRAIRETLQELEGVESLFLDVQDAATQDAQVEINLLFRELVDFCAGRGIALRMKLHYNYLYDIAECEPLLAAVAPHLQELEIGDGLRRMRDYGMSPKAFAVAKLLCEQQVEPLHFDRLGILHLRTEAREKFPDSFHPVESQNRGVLSIPAFITRHHMPFVVDLVIGSNSHSLEHIPLLAEILLSRKLPRLENFDSDFALLSESTTGVRDWKSGMEKKCKDLVQEACDKRNLGGVFTWKASNDESDDETEDGNEDEEGET